MMGEVFPPMLSLPATLLLYAITTFSGNSSLVHAPSVAQPHGCATKHGDTICCDFPCQAERFPAGGSQPQHPHCLTPKLYANDISGRPSEQRDAMCWNMDSEPLQCYSRPCRQPQPIFHSVFLHCQPSPQPYASTPLAITPFLKRTTLQCMDVSFPWPAAQCALDLIFSYRATLSSSPPPTTCLPEAGKCSSAPANASSPFPHFSFTAFAQCLAKVCPAYTQSSAHNWLAIRRQATGQPNHSNSIAAEICAEVCAEIWAEACAEVWADVLAEVLAGGCTEEGALVVVM